MDEKLLIDGALSYGFVLDDSTVEAFRSYHGLLQDWNSRMNLVSSGDMPLLVQRHFLDSLKIASVISVIPEGRMMDFGSGAGFPGIPLALVFPSSRWVLVESRLKRALFLEESVKLLGLNASVIRSRVEDLSDVHHNSYDHIFTRATVSLADFYLLANRFLSPGGSLVAIKGSQIEEELDRLKTGIDTKVFNIETAVPTLVEGVRSGIVVIISKK